MVRLTTISNVLSGIGITVLGFAAIIKFMLQILDITGTLYPLYAWIVGAALLVVVLIMSSINTFTEKTGFVNPEDKLVSNMFVFLTAIFAILIFGYLDPVNPALQVSLFNIATMIVIAYVFLFVFVYFSGTITKGSEKGQIKELTSRFMLVSLLLGVVMAAVKVGFDWILTSVNFYEGAAVALGLFAVVLVVVTVMFLGRKYEPVGE
ncbi:MAG: hypothetical protein C4K49_07940 [Candidatus Thorarchaeota archaeon]|nr:MAG: hypothetical protein C4K49_07940 [Candidatus Thorarchaeota archaeon]